LRLWSCQVSVSEWCIQRRIEDKLADVDDVSFVRRNAVKQAQITVLLCHQADTLIYTLACAEVSQPHSTMRSSCWVALGLNSSCRGGRRGLELKGDSFWGGFQVITIFAQNLEIRL
jgi:hypothetical protein